MRSFSFSAPPGYQNGWEGPGKLCNSALSELLLTTRSVKCASVGAGNESVKQAAHAGRVAWQRFGKLLDMFGNSCDWKRARAISKPHQELNSEKHDVSARKGES